MAKIKINIIKNIILSVVSWLIKAGKTILNFLKNLFIKLGPVIGILLIVIICIGSYFIHAIFFKNGDTFKQQMQLTSEIEKWSEKAQPGSLSTKISGIVVGSDAAKSKLEQMINNKHNPEYEYKIKKAAELVVSRRKLEVDKLFGEIIQKVDDPNGFARRHYEERNEKELMVKYMNQELLSEDTLLDFLNATAYEIDSALYSVVNEELDCMLRQMQTEHPNSTLDELKSRMPSAREICSEIYDNINNEMVSKLQENGLLEFADKYIKELNNTELVKNLKDYDSHNKQIEKGKSLTARGVKKILVGSVLLATAHILLASNPVGWLITGFGIAGAISVGCGSYDTIGGIYECLAGAGKNATGAAYEALEKAIKAKKEQCIKEYINVFKNSVAKTGETFKLTLTKAVNDIFNCYKNMDIFKNATITVDDTPVKRLSVEPVLTPNEN